MSRLFDALESIEKRRSAESEDRLPSFSNPCCRTARNHRKGLLLPVTGVLIVVLASAAWVFFKGPAMPLNRRAAAPSAGTDTPTRPIGMGVSPKIFNEIPLNMEKEAHEPPARPPAMTSNRGTCKATPVPKHQKDKNDRNRVATGLSSGQNQHMLKTSGIFSPDVKRMLQQAKELQDSGHIRQAADIYENLWNSTQNPLIANNFAACLIVCGKLKEARTVLKDALEIAPNDPDLLYNLALTNHR